MKVYITCENCGKKRSFVWSIGRLPQPENAFKEGWRCSEGKYYCPACAFGKKEDRDTLGQIWADLWNQLPAGSMKHEQ